MPSFTTRERGCLICQSHRFVLVWCVCSLVPRAFPPPVFDCLQYANMEGEGLGDWSCAVMSVRQKVDTRGVVPNEES